MSGDRSTPTVLVVGATGYVGDRGWFFVQPLWQLRGVVDRLAGEIGMRRRRRHLEQIGAGDVIGRRAAGASCL